MKAAIWVRVSDEHQSTDAQLAELRAWAARRDLDVVRVYKLDGKSAFSGKHRPDLDRALHDARMGTFDVLLVWALDRLSREGAEATLSILRRFREFGVIVWSQRESWTETSDPRMADLLASIFGWMSEAESARRGERIRMGMAARKAKGLPVGRRAGARDRKARSTAGLMGNTNNPRSREG